jgi:4-nitrophenyl phosphatase/NagD protein
MTNFMLTNRSDIMQGYLPAREDYEFLRDKKCFIFDIDGTVARGTTPIPEAVEFILKLRATGRRVVFYTNNPNRSHAQAADYLNSMGFETNEDEIFSSAEPTVEYLKAHYADARIFLVGVPDMTEHFAAEGFRVVGMDADEADVVLVGFDKTLTYDKVAKACHLICNGAMFLATHPDLDVPVEQGRIPDCGSICAMIAAVTDKQPLYLGKPNPIGLPLLENMTGLQAKDMCMVGDRLYTDIEFGNRAGMTSLLVLTGATDVQGAKIAVDRQDEQSPCVVLPHLRYVTELLD